jgi:hypothetical protein
MKVYWGILGVAPRIVDLGTRSKWVVSFHTPAALHAEKEPLVPIW